MTDDQARFNSRTRRQRCRDYVLATSGCFQQHAGAAVTVGYMPAWSRPKPLRFDQDTWLVIRSDPSLQLRILAPQFVLDAISNSINRIAACRRPFSPRSYVGFRLDSK